MILKLKVVDWISHDVKQILRDYLLTSLLQWKWWAMCLTFQCFVNIDSLFVICWYLAGLIHCIPMMSSKKIKSIGLIVGYWWNINPKGWASLVSIVFETYQLIYQSLFQNPWINFVWTYVSFSVETWLLLLLSIEVRFAFSLEDL